jgi:hypothetical protein
LSAAAEYADDNQPNQNSEWRTNPMKKFLGYLKYIPGFLILAIGFLFVVIESIGKIGRTAAVIVLSYMGL